MRVGEQEQDRSQAVGCDVGGDIHHRSLIYCFLEGSYQVQSALRGDGGQGAVPGGYAMELIFFICIAFFFGAGD